MTGNGQRYDENFRKMTIDLTLTPPVPKVPDLKAKRAYSS